MQQILAGSSPLSRLFYLFLFAFLGLFVASGLSIGVSRIFNLSGADAGVLYVTLFLQSAGMFLLPAYTVAAWSSREPLRYLKLQKTDGAERGFLLAVMVYVLSYAFVAFLTRWNQGITLPESMHGIEQYMRAMEDSAMETTDRLLSGQTIGTFLLNFLIMAVLAAVAEELFFRGALQQFIEEWAGNGHVAVWVSAFIFSALHMQFYGFFPRLALGVLLGYLFFYTRNLWVPIIMHLFNNGVIVVVYFLRKEDDWTANLDDMPLSLTFGVGAVLSVFFTVWAFRWYLSGKRRKGASEEADPS